MTSTLRGLYPNQVPTQTGFLAVDERHTIYFEECGNPRGKPVVVLHGGPGSGCNPTLRRLHDPDIYRIVLFDQRGCGRSTPYADLTDNTTAHLVNDIEALRHHLQVERWQVFGGSWGSTLALAYAQAHPERVTELVMRSIFTLRRSEVLWFYSFGASELFPDGYQRFVEPIPQEERDDIIAAYHRRLTGPDPEVQQQAARAWSQWEGRTLSLKENPGRVQAFGNDRYALAFARIECHYFHNRGFLETDGQLLSNAHKIAHIPTTIVHGRYDVVTPYRNAFDLKAVMPQADLNLVPDAGHAVSEPGITDRLVRATDQYGRF